MIVWFDCYVSPSSQWTCGFHGSIAPRTKGQGWVCLRGVEFLVPITSAGVVLCAEYDWMTDPYLLAEPASGWRFKHWSLEADGEPPYPVSGTGNPIAMDTPSLLDDLRTVTAVFEPDESAPTFTLDLSRQGGIGNVQWADSNGQAGVAGTSTHTENDVVTLSTEVAAPYRFHHWEENGQVIGTSPMFQYRVHSNRTIKAVCTENRKYPLYVFVSGNGSVARASSAAEYTHGTVVTLTAQPAPGWEFVGWKGAAAPKTEGLTATVSMTAARTVTAEMRPSAHFSISLDLDDDGTPETFKSHYAQGEQPPPSNLVEYMRVQDFFNNGALDGTTRLDDDAQCVVLEFSHPPEADLKLYIEQSRHGDSATGRLKFFRTPNWWNLEPLFMGETMSTKCVRAVGAGLTFPIDVVTLKSVANDPKKRILWIVAPRSLTTILRQPL